MNKKIINMVITIIALAGMLCATSVFAFPIVTNWSYTIDSGLTPLIQDSRLGQIVVTVQ